MDECPSSIIMYCHVLVDPLFRFCASYGHESGGHYKEVNFGVFGEDGRGCAFDVGHDGDVAGYKLVRSGAANGRSEQIIVIEMVETVGR